MRRRWENILLLESNCVCYYLQLHCSIFKFLGAEAISQAWVGFPGRHDNNHVLRWQVSGDHICSSFASFANEYGKNPRRRRGEKQVERCFISSHHSSFLNQCLLWIKVCLLEDSCMESDGGENFMYRHPILKHENWSFKPTWTWLQTRKVHDTLLMWLHSWAKRVLGRCVWERRDFSS